MPELRGDAKDMLARDKTENDIISSRFQKTDHQNDLNENNVMYMPLRIQEISLKNNDLKTFIIEAPAVRLVFNKH